jgi:hypothetical protein
MYQGKKHRFVTKVNQCSLHLPIGLPTYVPKGFAHQPLDGGQLGDSFGKSLHGGYMFGRPPFHPPFGCYKWPTLSYTTCTKISNQATLHETTISNLCQKHLCGKDKELRYTPWLTSLWG